MKLKFILTAILCIALNHSVEAQFLKKLKQKAENAAERTILNKTDEMVSKKTEKTIDDVATGNNEKPDNQNPETDSNTSSSPQTGQSPSFGSMPSHSASASKMPDLYEFDWEFKTEIKTSKDEAMEMNYLINSGSKDYFGMELSSEELKGKGTMKMVTDVKQKSMNMFMDMNGQKMAQTHKIPEEKSGKEGPKFSIKEIGSKTILGYTCYGMQVENSDYIADVYFTLDAPVNFSAFFAFANNKKGPKGFDPALLQVLEEDALLMEMNGTDKKKKNQSFTMTAISLEKKENQIKTGDYQKMPGF